MKTYVVGGSNSYARWFDHELVSSIDEAELVLFTGGTDVDPALYGEPRHPMTQPSDKSRDKAEVKAFKEAVVKGKHLLGICRGHQFLCVMAGGKLVQHQPNLGTHPIKTWIPLYDGYPTEITCRADHHQAAFPWGIKGFRLLGYTDGLLRFRQGGNGQEMGFLGGSKLFEVEDGYYPSIKALGIQSHPEWEEEGSPAVTHYRKLLDLHLSDSL